jgi:hypothetical protein
LNSWNEPVLWFWFFFGNTHNRQFCGKSKNCTTLVFTSVGWFSLFCENRMFPVLSYIIFLGRWENWSGYQIIFFSNSPGSQIGQLSYIQQQPVFTTWLFIFSVIKISFNFSDDDFKSFFFNK